MKFTLNTLGQHYASSECFYQIHTEQATFYSAIYSDKSAALLAMEEFVLRLRNRRKTKVAITQRNAAYTLQPFGKDVAVVRPGTAFTDKLTAIEVLEQLLAAVKADSFPLRFLELAEPLPDVTSIHDLNLQNGIDAYPWVEVDTGVLRIGVQERGGATIMGMPIAMSSSLGMSPLAGTKPCAPLFNALQPQVAADLPFFMGRKREVEDLYALTINHRLLLIYGKARVGKTSLIQCGLANRIKATPGELFVHRRGTDGMLPSLQDALRAEIATISGKPAPEAEDPLDSLIQLQALVDRTVYLVFDQLERLFDSSITEKERQSFFAWVQHVSEQEELPCRIILSLREKFLAPLAEYETTLPELLTHRLRVQTLNKRSMVDLSVNLLDVLKSQGKLDVDKPELVAEKMCSQLANEKGDVPFQCLQIYLQEIHQKSCAESGGERPVFDPDLIDRMEPATEVINQYLTRKLTELEALLPEDEHPADPEVLQQIEDIKSSQQHCGCGQTQAIVPVAVAAVAPSRPAYWWLWPLLLALGFGGLTYWFLNNWTQHQDPCYLAEQEDSCTAYLNYLSEYGSEAPCAADFEQRLAERQCAVWDEYKLLLATPTCGAYQNFFQKYRNTRISTEMVQRRLLEWSCPLVRDTVEVTIRDTITRTITVPNSQGRAGGRIAGDAPSTSAGCKIIGGTNFKQVGPLWFMTKPLPGGPYTWESALNACQAKGWRLPCIGEVDFLIDNIYRGQPDRAYRMLSGSGACFLFNPSTAPNRRIDFWTGTEANDVQAWSFYFDTRTNTIGRESNIAKSRALPCLCVKREVTDAATDLPPCYNKRMERE
jgi:hypothetical protein